MIRTFVVLIPLVILFYAPPANGTPITNPGLLNPGATLIDFEQFTNGQSFGTSLTIQGVTFTSVTGSLSILDIAASGWPANGTAVTSKTLFPGAEPDSAILIEFSNPVSQFILGWGDPNFAGNVLRAYDANGNLLEEAAVALGPVGGVHAAWIGFSRSTDDIARILVQPAQPLPSGDDFVIDNIYFHRGSPQGPPIPEPSSILLLGSGLAGLVGVRHYRQWNRR